jgi:hypothetical protein
MVEHLTRKIKENPLFFAVVGTGFSPFHPGSCYRHSLYLPHREKKVRSRKKGRQTVIVTVSAAGGEGKGRVNSNNDKKHSRLFYS